MKRLPLIPTVMTIIALAILVTLGLWQLRRAEWKRELIATLNAAASLPPVSPAEFRSAMMGDISVQYRRAELPCAPGEVLPYDVKGGSSAKGDSGFLVLVSCRPNNRPPDIVAVAGWSRRADAGRRTVKVDTVFRGLVIERPYGDAPARPRFMLIPDTAAPPLVPSRLPSPGDLPDNHLSYAGQWFGLAGVLAIIYALWMRRRWRDTAVASAAAAS